VSRLTDLLKQARTLDAQLGADLEAEFRALRRQRTFGLVFERHHPEAVELPGRQVRRGDKVRILPARGETGRADDRLWRVVRITGRGADRQAHLRLLDDSTDEPTTQASPVADLVTVAEFRDPIFPGLVETGRVERGGDRPYHTVINAENFHALETLTYTHRHRVDAIYIDPPYNTGARDWKYNNDYVEADDDYRHSKWLAMMERRLKIARELLNPEDSVLIVTIDEKEYLRLGLLLEQKFPEARIQMISSLVNPANSSRHDEFGRSNEFLYFLYFGEARPSPLPLGADWHGKISGKRKNKIRWQELSRRGDNGRRSARPNLFYPIFVVEDGSRFHSVGDSLPLHDDPQAVQPPAGTVAVWPIRHDGSHGTWGRGPESLRDAITAGHVRLGGFTRRGMAVYHLATGEQEKIRAGVFPVVGRREDGSVIVDDDEYISELLPGTQWNLPSHNASTFGSALLRQFLPDRRFPFPKSLYAVEDALRFFVKEKPEAVIVDFFAGSGTTTHAVMRLNRQDGGHRQCILVTNNEVAADEQKALRAKGLRPGDPEWEALGICDYITKPRIEAAITGRTPAGEPIKGDYRFTDEFPMSEGFEENAAFFTLTYEAPLSVAHHRAFAKVAPLLWLRAGSAGRIIDDLGERGWDVAETYAVLENLDNASDFIGALTAAPGVRLAFIVTDDEAAFQLVCRDLPAEVSPIRLYESYLHNFAINSGRIG